jgi:uncharacterized repeat protein (TIGR01451 family)
MSSISTPSSTLCLNRRAPTLWALAALCALSCSAAWAQFAVAGTGLTGATSISNSNSTSTTAETRLATRLVLSRVVTDAGAEKLAPAAAVQPGDVLQYTAHFGNPTAAPMREVVATVPVPAGTQWLPRSAQPSGALASVDGAIFAPMPLMRKQLLPNGQWTQVAVPLSEIRFLRWPARDLATSESFSTQLRVLVLSSDGVNASLAAPVAADLSRTQLAVR